MSKTSKQIDKVKELTAKVCFWHEQIELHRALVKKANEAQYESLGELPKAASKLHDAKEKLVQLVLQNGGSTNV